MLLDPGFMGPAEFRAGILFPEIGVHPIQSILFSPQDWSCLALALLAET